MNRFVYDHVLDIDKQDLILKNKAIHIRSTHGNYKSTVLHLDAWSYHTKEHLLLSIKNGGKTYLLASHGNPFFTADTSFNGSGYLNKYRYLKNIKIPEIEAKLIHKKGLDNQIKSCEQKILIEEETIKKVEIQLLNIRTTYDPTNKKSKIK